MKKHLIALAALAATGAFAQSSVTLYGVVDVGYSNLRTTSGATTTSVTGQQSIASGSRVGFKGDEDLGGGLKANFVLEYGVAPDESTTPMSNRQSYVGLSGGFGSLNLGRQYTLIHGLQAGQDPNGNATAAGWLAGMTNSIRQSNAYTYTTPSMSGLSVSVQFADGENTDGSTGNATSFGVNYANGPLTAGLVQETIQKTALSVTLPGATAVNSFGTRTATALSNALTDRIARSAGIGYNFGAAKVSYVNTSAEAGNAADAGSLKSNNFGVSVPVGKLTLAASVSNGNYVDSNAADVSLNGYTVGATYSLSKRTTAYAFIGQAKTGAATEQKDETTAVGIRHTF